MLGQAAQPGDQTIQGELDPTAANGPTLTLAGHVYVLTAKAHYLLHTLEDSRLAHREMRLIGARLADGKFEVHKLFSVKDGKLYKVRYYCDTCNITAVEPGNCVCCGQPTKLQEVPAHAPDE